jgi:hypothetical protein
MTAAAGKGVPEAAREGHRAASRGRDPAATACRKLPRDRGLGVGVGRIGRRRGASGAEAVEDRAAVANHLEPLAENRE